MTEDDFKVGVEFEVTNWTGDQFKGRVLADNGRTMDVLWFEMNHRAYSYKDTGRIKATVIRQGANLISKKQYSAKYNTGLVAIKDGSATCELERDLNTARFSGWKWVFDSYDEALAAVQLRSDAGGMPVSAYTIFEIVPTISGKMNASCGTCEQPFPYDALPSNRPDGLTDCTRCKIMKGVFHP